MLAQQFAEGSVDTDRQQTQDNAKPLLATVNKNKASTEECPLALKSRFERFMFTPTDISPLVYFRIVFGAIMLWEVWRFFNGGTSPKIERYYINPRFYFRYYGLEWVPGPLPGLYMYHFFAGMALLYTFLILGLWYRITTVLSWLGFTYWFLLDETMFLNHFYLVSLIHFLLIFVPAHRNCSLDVFRYPELRVAKVPSWTLWLLILQVAIPYVYGGFAKFHPDWRAGEPMNMWMKKKMTMYPLSIVGDQIEDDWWVKYFFSWGGMMFDLFIVPLLLYKPTRPFAIVNNIFFHLMNAKMFQIGIFPWMMMFLTPLFFEPEWVRPVLKLEWFLGRPVTTERELTQSPRSRKWVIGLFCLWFTVQGLFPFRHHMFSGDVNWTEESYYFSWLMMIRSKKSTAKYHVKWTKTGEILAVDTRKFLSSIQAERHEHIPGMILQFSHHLCDYYGRKGDGPVEVYVDSKSSYNGRAYQRLIYPDRDLCECEENYFSQADWIVPMTTPLSEKRDNLPEWVPKWERRSRSKSSSSTRKSKKKIEETGKKRKTEKNLKGPSKQKQYDDNDHEVEEKEQPTIRDEDVATK